MRQALKQTEMINWLTIPTETQINAYNQVAEHIGIPPSVAEKTGG